MRDAISQTTKLRKKVERQINYIYQLVTPLAVKPITRPAEDGRPAEAGRRRACARTAIAAAFRAGANAPPPFAR